MVRERQGRVGEGMREEGREGSGGRKKKGRGRKREEGKEGSEL